MLTDRARAESHLLRVTERLRFFGAARLATGTAIGSGQLVARWMVEDRPEYGFPMVCPSRSPTNSTRRDCLNKMESPYAQGHSPPEPTVVNARLSVRI